MGSKTKEGAEGLESLSIKNFHFYLFRDTHGPDDSVFESLN